MSNPHQPPARTRAGALVAARGPPAAALTGTQLVAEEWP